MFWLNENQGAVMAILTMIYVVTTAILVIQNKRTLKEIEISRKLGQRPYLYAEITKTSEFVFVYSLQIRNRGKSPAKLKSITIEPALFLNEKIGIESLNEMIFLPGQCLSLIIKDDFKDFHKNVYNFTLEYESLRNETYTESYSIPLAAYLNTGTPYLLLQGKDSTDSALKNIAGILASMNKKI
jgi:hypothetical protein